MPIELMDERELSAGGVGATWDRPPWLDRAFGLRNGWFLGGMLKSIAYITTENKMMALDTSYESFRGL
jgi:hypothetical protein